MSASIEELRYVTHGGFMIKNLNVYFQFTCCGGKGPSDYNSTSKFQEESPGNVSILFV